MTSPTIRPASQADLTAITTIYAEAVRNGTGTFETEPPDAREMEARWSRLTSAGFPYLVAAIGNGAVAGYAYAGPYHARAAYRHTVEDSIYLAPDWRGKGIGRRLLKTLIDESAGRGFRQMVAIIGDSGNAGSVRLHAACGFRPVGTLAEVGWKFGRWLDVVMMQLTLGAGGGEPPDRS